MPGKTQFGHPEGIPIKGAGRSIFGTQLQRFQEWLRPDSGPRDNVKDEGLVASAMMGAWKTVGVKKGKAPRDENRGKLLALA